MSPRRRPPCVLTIAGSDSGGGAGIQADIKAMTALGVYSASVITALTAQNTGTPHAPRAQSPSPPHPQLPAPPLTPPLPLPPAVGVQAVHVPPPAFLEQQLRSVLSDIPVTVAKVGMLPDAATVRLVCAALRAHAATIAHVVVDPVLVSTSGDTLAGGGECLDAIRAELLPLTTVLTPNIPEAARILGVDEGGVASVDGMRKACEGLCGMGARAVLVKGGHMEGVAAATDVFYDGAEFEAIALPWVETKNTHGTGCTLASSIAALLAKGNSLSEAIREAKRYVHRAIETSFDVGEGHGPLNHMHVLDTLKEKERC